MLCCAWQRTTSDMAAEEVGGTDGRTAEQSANSADTISMQYVICRARRPCVWIGTAETIY